MRVRKTYQDYIDTVVKNCGHKWLILEHKSFKDARIIAYNSGKKIELPNKQIIKIIPARCKSYSCPICGKKKVYDLLDKLKGLNLKKYRFFTLTLKSIGNLDDTERNLNRIVECFNKLNKKLRKENQYKDLKFFRICEIGKNTGMVHIHGIWNKYIPVSKLSKYWYQITKDSYKVDVRRIESKKDVVNYLYKYLTKTVSGNCNNDPAFWNMDKKNTAAIFYENGKRRFASSRGFFKNSVKISDGFIPFYHEKHDPVEIDKIIIYLIREYGLKKEHFNFDLYYYSVFSNYLFDSG